MAKLKIVVAGAPVLREVAQPVERIDKKLQRLLRDMAETMYAADGVGLAAPQVGVSKRVVVIDVGEGLYELINPEIVKREGKVLGSEGCLSVPDYEGEVERSEYVECEFTDKTGQRMLLSASGLLAICIQHELDHLDGILFIDKAKTISPKQKENPEDAVNDSGEYYIFEVTEIDGEEELAEIEDDDKLDRIAAVFEERYNEEFYDEDD